MTTQKDKSIEIIRNPQEEDDDTCATFVFNGEGHTLGNSLRHVLSGSDEVEFCGYCIPHPSQNKINFRIQTKNVSAESVLADGLKQLYEVGEILEDRFDRALAEFLEKNS